MLAMPEHGQFDPSANKWYCGYWMTFEEWEDIHDYSPPNMAKDEPQESEEEE